ncbi:MAG: metallophosphoesterase [Firmicutes bacterium]|nr:metallophosphoesterase [Bacillota bacterium]
MRILVISDTHRKLNRAIELVHDFSKSIDAVIHLGDNTDDVDFIRRNYRLPVYTVAGNCDYGSTAPPENIVTFEDKKVFFTHGHAYNVKYNADMVKERAESFGADICLFGHTHMPCVKIERGIIVMNPGSLTEPRGGSKPSYGIIKIENGKIYPMVIPYI